MGDDLRDTGEAPRGKLDVVRLHTLKSLKGRIDADDGCIRDRSPDRTPRGAANAMHAIEKA